MTLINIKRQYLAEKAATLRRHCQARSNPHRNKAFKVETKHLSLPGTKQSPHEMSDSRLGDRFGKLRNDETSFIKTLSL